MSFTDIPETPAAFSASRTCSSLKGLMKAMISFIPQSFRPSESGHACAASAVRRLGMFCQIQAAVFDLFGDADADRRFQSQHDQGGHNEAVGDGAGIAQGLRPEQIEPTPIERACQELPTEELRVGEQADG